MPTALNAFLRLHLGVWTEAEVTWLSSEVAGLWQSHQSRRTERQTLLGRIGLASTQDLSALVLSFPDSDGVERNEESDHVTILPFFWACDRPIAIIC